MVNDKIISFLDGHVLAYQNLNMMIFCGCSKAIAILFRLLGVTVLEAHK